MEDQKRGRVEMHNQMPRETAPPPQRVFGIGYYGTLARPLHTYKINASPFKHLQNIVHLSSLLLTQMGNTMEKLLLLGPLD